MRRINMEQLPSGGGENRELAGEKAERVQHFQFGPWLFNVNGARAIIEDSPREPRNLPVVQWARFYGLDSVEGQTVSLFTPLPSFDRDYAMTTDLSEPLLVAALRSEEGEEFPLLIDGTHRLYRAFVEGVNELPAYLLSIEESLAIREDGAIGRSVHWPGRDPGGAGEPGDGGG
jgi:hypothetical protein